MKEGDKVTLGKLPVQHLPVGTQGTVCFVYPYDDSVMVDFGTGKLVIKASSLKISAS